MNTTNGSNKEEFNPKDWKPYLVTEKGEKCLCACKNIIDGGEIGSHFYCKKCGRYVWKEKS